MGAIAERTATDGPPSGHADDARSPLPGPANSPFFHFFHFFHVGISTGTAGLDGVTATDADASHVCLPSAGIESSTSDPFGENWS